VKDDEMDWACSTNARRGMHIGYWRERPRRSWVSNGKMDLKVVGWGSMDWIDLAQAKD
jgi:hypothetical protein